MPAASDALLIPSYDTGVGANSGPPPGGGLWGGGPFWSGEGGFVRASNVLRAQSNGWSLLCSATAAAAKPGGFAARIPAVAGGGEYSFWLLSSVATDAPTAYMVSVAGTSVSLRRFNAGADNWLTSTTATISAGHHLALLVDSSGVMVARSSDGGTSFASLLTYADTTIAGPFYAGIEADQSGYTFDLIRFGTLGGGPSLQEITGTPSISAYASHIGAVVPAGPQEISAAQSPSGYASQAGEITRASAREITGASSPSAYASRPATVANAASPTEQHITGARSGSRYRSQPAHLGRPTPPFTLAGLGAEVYDGLAAMHAGSWPSGVATPSTRTTPAGWAAAGTPMPLADELHAALTPMHPERWPDGE